MAKSSARRQIFSALKASNHLSDIASALEESGTHMATFRSLTAPPISQDQFKLSCKEWPKGTEKSGKPLKMEQARASARAIESKLDRTLARWKSSSRKPTRREIHKLVHATEITLARQQFETIRRNDLAAQQEGAFVELLEELGWQKLPSKVIDERADLPRKTYMHKAKFATRTRPAEVDVACGFGGTVVLATECKVTNDQTNSVKRINDILKKAESWRAHWGSFVQTAALLDGVIHPKDIERLLEAQVRVFWSHKMHELRVFLSD